MKIDSQKLRSAMMPENQDEKRRLGETEAVLVVALQRIAVMVSLGEKFEIVAVTERGPRADTLQTY